LNRFTALTAATVAALIAGSPAAAQTWTAQPASENWDAAAVAQWESGATMVARCKDGDFRLFNLLIAPMEGMAATVEYRFDDEEVRSELSALSSTGSAVFARRPVDLARRLLAAESLDMRVSDGRTAPQRYILQAPAEASVLGEVLTACGQRLTPPPEPRTITNPEWIHTPVGTDLARLYPHRALEANTGGGATIQCLVAADGRLQDCLPVSEDPEGEGFGAATLAMAPLYRMRPTLADGTSVEGALVEVSVRWRLR